ncbi:MAG: amidohydrolase family protein [Desulfobacterales bacterium]|nr:amidohydrolase family protein [Desulfobacterales bacterium]
MIIDIFCHHISVKAGKMLNNPKGYGEGEDYFIPSQNADPEIRLRLMDKYGVDIQALSQTTPQLMGLNSREADELCRISNDDNYALCKAYPDRFVNICILSLLDMKTAMTELDRSINELDCRGVTIATNQQGKGIDSEEYFPFYEKMVQQDLPVFLHPLNWQSYPLVKMKEGWNMMHVFGWPFDTTQAVWRLIFGGIIDRFPALKVVTHHLGGMLPFFSRRAETNFNRFLSDKLPRHITEYWGNFYGDTALDGTAGAFMCGYEFFGPDRMLFGSDYPFGMDTGEDFIRENLNCIKNMSIPPEAREKILGENSRKLLKIAN